MKLLRYGYRRGGKIVVNRQLCIANAFEQWLMECFPRFHHWVRFVYDRYGFPLAKHIHTRKQANLIYLLMKPLEYIFLFILYTVDEKPENRITLQYTIQ